MYKSKNNAFYRLSTFVSTVIRRRYSLLEVLVRRIHNVIANAMSMFNNTPHSALSCHSLPQGARECGRSMIEMLGVLAIVAVLSVGGIAGYSKAMEKFKLNKVVYDFNMLIMNMLEHEDSMLKIGENGENSLVETLYALDMVPSNWKKLNSQYIEDSLGNLLNIYNRNIDSEVRNGIIIDYVLGGMSSDEQGNNVSKNFNGKLCFELFNTVIIPQHNVFKRGRMFPNESYVYYGDAYCDGVTKPCLKDLPLSVVKKWCNSCSGIERCNITVNF